MTYTVLKNNGWGDFHWEGYFNSLREARAYCKAMTYEKRKLKPLCNNAASSVLRFTKVK